MYRDLVDHVALVQRDMKSSQWKFHRLALRHVVTLSISTFKKLGNWGSSCFNWPAEFNLYYCNSFRNFGHLDAWRNCTWCHVTLLRSLPWGRPTSSALTRLWSDRSHSARREDVAAMSASLTGSVSVDFVAAPTKSFAVCLLLRLTNVGPQNPVSAQSE